jgi:hypothetical protein
MLFVKVSKFGCKTRESCYTELSAVVFISHPVGIEGGNFCIFFWFVCEAQGMVVGVMIWGGGVLRFPT